MDFRYSEMKKISKASLIQEVSKTLNVDEHVVTDVIDEFLAEISHNLSEGRNVYLKGFATLKYTPKSERYCYSFKNKRNEMQTTRPRISFAAHDSLRKLLKVSGDRS